MSRLIIVTSIVIFLIGLFLQIARTELRVELVQVLFRHGERTPRLVETYPNDPYNISTYEPWGLGQLTNQGKMREYRIGEMLRQRYDTFLGDLYRPSEVYAVSSDVDRTKMSLELVLAGLYPPNSQQNWNENLAWMPIPIHFMPEKIDTLLKPHLTLLYNEVIDKVRKSDEVNKKTSIYQDFLMYLSKETGLNITDTDGALDLFNILTAQKSMNLTLPDWITDDVHKKIEEMAVLEYNIRSYTTQLKRLNGGMLVKRFIDNIQRNMECETSRKIYLYSGHEVNIAAFAKAHGFEEPKIPGYGSAFIFEKLRNETGDIFVRILFWSGSAAGNLLTFKVKGCNEACPLDEYLNIIGDIIPSKEEIDYVWNHMTIEELRDQFKEQLDPN